MALLVLLAGCGQASPLLPRPGAGSARIVAGAATEPTAGFRTQAVVAPNTAASVDRLRFQLWQVVDGVETLLATRETPSGSGTGKTVDWSNLKAGWTYRLKVWALDQAGATLNSGGLAATLDVTTTWDDEPIRATVGIALADKTFSGTVHPVITTSKGNERKTDHVRVTLEERISGTWVSQAAVSTPAGSGLTRTVEFSDLKMHTPYRLKVELIRKTGAIQAAKTVEFATADDDWIDLNVNV